MDDISLLLKPILQNSFSKTDILRRLHLIREFLEASFFSGSRESLDSFCRRKNLSPLDSQFLFSLGKNFFQSFSSKNMYKILDRIDKEVKNVPAVIMYLPYIPDENEIYKLGLWFKENLKKDMLIEIKNDREKIGGCALSKEGYYNDYSLHHFISKRKSEILSLLDEYDKNRPAQAKQ
ncbi:hypothetical protein M1271_02495 [Patescibacteria group bacterium]|nr:hypothetical protein [Patescibacteria group bacterium]MCL5797642.1 hypothetical protein [Patescibacteria group bacterium]